MKEKYMNTKYGRVFVRIDNENMSMKNGVIIMLHGFGMNHKTFDNLCERFKDYYILRFDFLGFGKSGDPSTPMGVNDNSKLLNEIIKRNIEQNKIYLIGHSFGGRVALEYASKNKVEKLFLINAKAFKNNSIRFRINKIIYKINKTILKLFSKERYIKYIESKSSRDYKTLNTIMKKSFVKIVNYNPIRKIKKIKSDTIIIASIKDQEVKYEESIRLSKYIKNSKLYPFYNSTHFSYIEEEDKVFNIIRREMRR